MLQIIDLLGKNPIPHSKNGMSCHIQAIKHSEQERTATPLAHHVTIYCASFLVSLRIYIKHLVTNQ